MTAVVPTIVPPPTLTIRLYRALTRLGAPIFRYMIRARARRGKEDTDRLAERFGYPSQERPAGQLLWVHGVSVGESLSALPLIDRLLARFPNAQVLLTTGTKTSADLMAKRLPQRVVHQYIPIDTISSVQRFLDHWRPDAALFMESELWPNLIVEASGRDIPLALLNARMSEKSFARWLRAKSTAKALLARFDVCLAQDTAIGGRLESLGARSVEIVGNLKYAAGPLPAGEAELDRLRDDIGERPVWLCASTHDAEERALGHVHAGLKEKHPNILTIVVPRHPERGADINIVLGDMGHSVSQRSLNEPITPHTDFYVADTIGELGLFYRLTDIVFVGGSLVPHGGQNPLEPARLHCAVLTGPNTNNFHAVYRDLLTAGAAEMVQNRDQLLVAVEKLLSEPQLVEDRANAGLKICTRADSVVARLMTNLDPLLTKLPKPEDAADPIERGAVQ